MVKQWIQRLPVLCRGDSAAINGWLEQPERRWILCCAVIIALGAGSYGATIGLWRAGLMALFVAIKLPLLIFLTGICNGMLNWMLASVMGAGFSLRQTVLAQLMSFTVASLILLAVAPITLFVLWNTPSLESGNQFGHRFFLLINVGVLALAGVVANVRLAQFLEVKTGNQVLARKVLAAWLVGNLLVGAQLSWNLRPFIGSPHLEIQFLRPDPFEGNFYESVWHSMRNL